MDTPRDHHSREDQFLATLAHELRNPLAPMRHCVSILERTCEQETSRIAVRVMDRQLRQMTRLVDDLLEVSRITRGTIEMHREPADLGEILDAAVETSRPVIDAERHALTVHKPSPPLLLDADPMRIAQVVSNLMDNAARFTDAGGSIMLEAVRDGDEAVISVSDTGIGISPDALPQVFDLFSQADQRPVSAHNGMGVGLALARSLVEMHGGTVTAASAGLGQGSRFEVRLPVRATEAIGDATAHGDAADKRILVVDDNHDAADTLATLLQMGGAEVEVAYNGPSALDAIDAFRPRVVVLDLGMPGMDGYEVARWIRHRRDLDKMTLIALTGWGAQADRDMTAEVGFDYHLTKPADIETVQEVLSKLD